MHLCAVVCEQSTCVSSVVDCVLVFGNMACMTSRVLMMSKVHACVCWHATVNDALSQWSGVKGEYAWHVCSSMGACLCGKSLSTQMFFI